MKWRSTPIASLVLKTQLPVAAFDSIFPCAPTARDCLPQPGITNPNQYLDILSYRQRPTWRLAYRNFKDYEALVTNQSVEAVPGIAGVRWYEIRRDRRHLLASTSRERTRRPTASIAGWAASPRTRRATWRLGLQRRQRRRPSSRASATPAGWPATRSGQMTQGEGMIINGSGVQTTTNSRWGDYTSMNIDPIDDCTFWYVNEYYTAAGQASSPAGWQTRIASFKLPGC